MKTASIKAAALVASLLAFESAGFSQGYVAFINGTTSRFSTNGVATADPTAGGPGLADPAPPGSYFFELLVAPTTQTTISPSLTGWTDTGVMGSNTTNAGRMAGSTYSDGIGCLIPGYGPTATANFAVLGWSANIGTTFAAALAAWNNGEPQYNYGVTSGIAFMGLSSEANNIALAPAGGPYNNVWGSSAVGAIPGMVLYPTYLPEPGSLALVGLGALVLFRRRK
jgi:hypothetical protein